MRKRRTGEKRRSHSNVSITNYLSRFELTPNFQGTTQACLFRDSYTPLTATGFKIYGLSTDSPKANTTFKTKQNLPYPLLCDPDATLIGAIGLKKLPKGTQRGVFVVKKDGEVLLREAGGPARTVDAVREIVESVGGNKEGKDGGEK